MATGNDTALWHIREAQNLLRLVKKTNEVNAETWTAVEHVAGELGKAEVLLDVIPEGDALERARPEVHLPLTAIEARELDADDRANVLAFLNHMMPLTGCALSGDPEFERGRLVIQRLATVPGPVALSLRDCADALGYLHCVQPAEGLALYWDERSNRDGGHIGCGLNQVLVAIETRLRADGTERVKSADEETEQEEHDRLVAQYTAAGQIDRACVLRLRKLGFEVYARETEGGYGVERVILDSDGEPAYTASDEQELERITGEAEDRARGGLLANAGAS